MRNHRFRFSSMIPSEWFHKLKNMTKHRKKHYPPPPPLYSFNTTKKRKPYSSESKSLPHSSRSYFSNTSSHTSLQSKILQISPRNSIHMIQSKRKSLYNPSSFSSSRVSPRFNKKNIKFQPKQDSSSSASFDDQKRSSSHFSNLKFSSSADNIIMEMNQKDFKKKDFKKKKFKEIYSTEKACPASNQTKESRKTHNLSLKVNNKEKEDEARSIQKKNQKTLVSSGRRSSAKYPPGIKLRVTSPRIQVSARKSKQSQKVLDSFAVTKRSVDPKKDFRESMVEMIEENNIRGSQDLEDLLTCYLSLNPKEYHDLIIKVFVKVWLEVINT